MSMCCNCDTLFSISPEASENNLVKLACSHRICLDCLKKSKSIHCAGCGETSQLDYEFISLKIEEGLHQRNEIEALKREKEDLKKEMGKATNFQSAMKTSQIDIVECSMCGMVDGEEMMNICTACSLKDHCIDVKKGEKVIEKEGFDINELAICSTCILDHHIGKQHKIVKFYPVLAATETDKYLPIFIEFRRKIGEMKGNIMASKDELINNLEIVNDQFENMFQLVKRSESSSATKTLIDCIAKRYEKMQTMNLVIEESVKAHVTESKRNTEAFEAENRKLDGIYCQNELGNYTWELCL